MTSMSLGNIETENDETLTKPEFIELASELMAKVGAEQL